MRTSRKEKVLEKLINSKFFISGEIISKELGISRTMVNRYIKELIKEGFEIDTKNNKGYKLKIVPDVLYKPLIENKLENKNYEIVILDDVDSTNNFAISNIQKFPDRTVVIAKNQTSGRGRMGRTWISEKDKDITMSIILKPNSPIDNLFKYVVYTSLAVFKTLKEFDIENISIKWPNDIIYKDKKLCGILIETTLELETKTIEAVIIGIGLNVNSRISNELPTAISVSEILGFEVKRNIIIAKILNIFERLINSNFESVLEEWKQKIAYLREYINIHLPNGEIRCKFLDISKTGEIIVEENGTIKMYNSGEISLSSSL